jgi:HSP20 family protein
MAKKPSFFQKLTGVNEIEDETPEEAQVGIEIEEEKEIPIPAPAPKKEPKKTEKPKPAPKKELEKEEWLPETEGQLTIDVYQTPNEIIIKSTIAGVSPEDVDISISNDMVTIKGWRQKDEEVQTEDYYYQECYWGAFSRSVILPVDIEADKVEAAMKNGILTIRLPKIEKVKTKKIKVKAG